MSTPESEKKQRLIETVERAWNTSELYFAALDPLKENPLGDLTADDMKTILGRKTTNAEQTMNQYARAMAGSMWKGKSTRKLEFSSCEEILKILLFQDFKDHQEYREFDPLFAEVFNPYSTPHELKLAAYRDTKKPPPAENLTIRIPAGKQSDPIFIQTKIKAPAKGIFKTAYRQALAEKNRPHYEERLSEEQANEIIRSSSLIDDVMGMKIVVAPPHPGKCSKKHIEACAPSRDQILYIRNVISAAGGFPALRKLNDGENTYTDPRKNTGYRAVIIHAIPSRTFVTESESGYMPFGIDTISFHILLPADYKAEHCGGDSHFLYKLRMMSNLKEELGLNGGQWRKFERGFYDMLERAGNRLGVSMAYFIR